MYLANPLGPNNKRAASRNVLQLSYCIIKTFIIAYVNNAFTLSKSSGVSIPTVSTSV